MQMKFRSLSQLACLLVVTLGQAVMAQESQHPGAASMGAEVKQTQITFEQGKLIEAAFIKITPGMETRLNEEYFSQVMPLAMSYGMKPLGLFKVTRVELGEDDAGLWGFFEWPSLEAKERFDADPQFIKLRAVRDSMLDSAKMIYLDVAETTAVTIREDRVYEFFGGWINRHNGAHLQQYFEVAGPWLASHGVVFPVKFNIVGSPEGYHFRPDTVGFIEWPSVAVKQAWFDSEEFKAVGYHRALAADRLYAVESEFVFKQ